MSFSELLLYIRSFLAHVTWEHWLLLSVLSSLLTALFLARKNIRIYGIIAFGIMVFMGLFMLDAAVVARVFGTTSHDSRVDLMAEFNRLFHGGMLRKLEMVANVAVFALFGFFLSEYLLVTKQLSLWHPVRLATLFSFVLSLGVECLQLFLRVGVFEVTDMVLNTAGGFIGAGMSSLGRSLFGRHV